MKSVLITLLQSKSCGWAPVAARVILGAILFPHGLQKVFGLFGGDGLWGTMRRFSVDMGYPSIIPVLIIFFEFFGSIFLVMGFFSRFMAFGIAVLMIGAILQVHIHYGYFLNWHNTKGGEGMQFNLLMIGMCILIMILGSGKYSVDKFMLSKL